MKIYQMLHFPLEGAGTGIYVDNLTRSLAKKGHQLAVLCSDHHRPKRDYPVETVLFSNGRNETFDLDFDFPVFASHPLSKGQKFGELSDAQLKAYFDIFRAKIESGTFQFAPDIIHVHHGWIIASILAEFDIPYVISLHGTEYYAFKNFANCRDFALRGLHNARIVLTLTQEERQQAVDTYGLETQKTDVVKSGVDTEKFKPLQIDRDELLSSHSVRELGRPVVFLGGRLTAQKGVDTLLRAAQIYSHTDEKPVTLIAGDGDLKQPLEELAARLKLDSVYFLGNQSHEQMIKLSNIADVVALPSVFEPFGLVAVEALACGTPVIASRIGGLTQIVNDQLGCFIEPGDYKALADKITALIKGRLKEKQRDKIVAYTRQNFSWDNTVSNIENIYERVLSARCP